MNSQDWNTYREVVEEREELEEAGIRESQRQKEVGEMIHSDARWKIWDRFVQRAIGSPWHMLSVNDQVGIGDRFNRAISIVLENSNEGWYERKYLQGELLYVIMRARTGATTSRTTYTVTPMRCDCPDNEKAPWGFCKHRILVWLYSQSKAFQVWREQEIAVPF